MLWLGSGETMKIAAIALSCSDRNALTNRILNNYTTYCGALSVGVAMSYTKVTRDQFEFARNEVKHKPTNASFFSYPGLNKVVCSVKWGRCGFMLDSGESYSRDEVEAFAKELMKTAQADMSTRI